MRFEYVIVSVEQLKLALIRETSETLFTLHMRTF